VRQGETVATEFKSALRKNLHTNAPDPRIELSILRTIAGFVNTDGGTLVIGVADDGSPVGIDVDGFPNEDKMYLHLVNLIKDRIGAQHAMYISPHFGDFDGVRVLTVQCKRGRAPVFVKDGNNERFFVRLGPSTNELSASQIQEYIKHRFGR
jgi:predicted HTH transcriptional regulator